MQSRVRIRCLTWLLAVVVFSACGGGSESGSTVSSAASVPATTASGESPALDAVVAVSRPGQWRSTGDDVFEVWICRVPIGATAALFGGLTLRLPLTPEHVTAVVTEQVTPYFETLSHGRYRPVFVVGGEASLGVDGEPQVCIDSALAAAADDTRAVLVVADAEHGSDQAGGFASGGEACVAPPCAAAQSQRFAYVGASDFHPDWGDAPPMDLVQHEIGHALGWMHSGVDAAGNYLSALDLMSNSAAARELEPDRRDGAGTLALNRFTAGWLPASNVWVAPAAGGSVSLSPSAGDRGVRMAVLPCCDDQFLTVELITADGFDSHLPGDGIAVHAVASSGGWITDLSPVFGESPYTDLLQPGDVLTTNGWVITVGEASSVTVEPALPVP